MSDAIGATGEGTWQASSSCWSLKCGHKIPSHPKAPKKSDVHLSKQKGDGVICWSRGGVGQLCNVL